VELQDSASSISFSFLGTFHRMTSHNDNANTLLIFDLDGTLNRTEATFVPSMREAYAQHNIPYVGDDAILNMVGETFPDFLDWLVAQGFPADANALAEEIAKYEFESIAQNGQLYPGVVETLHDLSNQGYRLAICTNGDIQYTSAVLGRFNLMPVFDGIKTFGDSQQTKTVMIGELLKQFQPEHAFMIGDRYHDFVAGKANGCTVVATTYGFAADGEADEVDVLLDDFVDLPAIVKRLVIA
jgi:phosphoglycolate phosphatase